MRIVLVPGVLALLPAYASLVDPVADIRAACLNAVRWLGTEVAILADPQGERVARYLLTATDRAGAEPSYLVVGNGSARRSEKAPGHVDERALGYDDQLLAWMTGRGPIPDEELGWELLAELRGLRAAERRFEGYSEPVQIDYDDDPFGVRYWVLRWEL